MQEVSRKRPHLGDSETLPSKKRAVSVIGTVPVNGTVLPTAPGDEEPRDQDSLEVNFMPFFSPYPFLHGLFPLFSNSERRLFSAA